MPSFTADPVSAYADLWSSSPTPRHQLGSRFTTSDGRVFRYAQAGAAPLVVGNLLQSSAEVTAHQNLTPSPAAAGDRRIVATLGAAAAAENLYAEGLAIIDTTPGLGYAYPIKGHTAVLSAGVITLDLPADGLIQVPLTAASRVSLQANPYKNVIQTPVTTLTSGVAGVAVFPILATQFGWIQTHGPAGVLISGAVAVGHAISAPSAAAGAAAINSTTLPILGYMLAVGVTTRVCAAFLTID